MEAKSIGINNDAIPAVARRRVLLGAAGAAAVGLVGSAAAPAQATTGARARSKASAPLWRRAAARGITFGSATSTRLFQDTAYSSLVDREAAILFVEDDLLW